VTIQISGQIAAGDSDAFIIAVKQATAAGKTIENVQLDSAGGKLIEGAKLAAAIRENKISTSVGQGAVCASACFLAFAAGDRKFVDTGAQIGVHKASDKGGRETVLSGAATLSMAHFAKDLGVPSAIIDRMVMTPPKQIAWLNSRDLQSMGVTMAEKPMQNRQAQTDGRSAQQTPEEFTSLAALTPQARVASASAPAWNEFIDKVAKLSAEQNDGNAIISRLCQPELKNCVLGLAYSLRDGRQGLAVVVQDLSGKTMRREVCEFSNANDARNCIDWDSGAMHRDEKNANGDWVQIKTR
jgi:ATP-dependent protease ClpP protease subunit